jgi:hypothetical protein
MKQPSYRIYPSLLDKFDKYLRADEEVESFWNIDNETGEYKRSPEEIEENLKQDLLDAINRVPFESEAADKELPSMLSLTAMSIAKITCRQNDPPTPSLAIRKPIPYK